MSPWSRNMLFAVYSAVSNANRDEPYAIKERRPSHFGVADAKAIEPLSGRITD